MRALSLIVLVALAVSLAGEADAAKRRTKRRAPKRVAVTRAKPRPNPKPAPVAVAADTTPAPAPVDSTRLAWTEARRLADTGRNAEALAVIRRGLRRDPDSADLKWLEAAVVGYAGKHAESVMMYERLLEDRPDLTKDVRLDLARERMLAGDLPGALRDLDRRVAEDPADREARMARALALSWADSLDASLAAYDSLLAERPGDPDTRAERARVLSWMGRNGEAAAEYRAVLAQDPANRGARLGLAMNENWQGHHRRAAAQLGAMANEPGADPEAWKALAFARYWNGESDRARVALDRYLAVRPNDREARELDKTLKEALRVVATLGFSRADDSDGERTETTSLGLEIPIGFRTTASLGAQRDNIGDAGGTSDPLRVSAGLQHMWSPAVTTNARYTYADFGDRAGTTGLVELGLVVRPEDRLRIDLGVSNDLVVSRLAVARGITARAWIGGVDWNATQRLTLRASERQRFYSDDNRSQHESAAAAWKAYTHRHGSVSALAGFDQLRTRRDLDNGYYDPEQYMEWGPGLAFAWTPRTDVTFSGTGRYGWQREKAGETEDYFNASGRAEWRLPAITLSLEGGRSNSNLASSSGYERRFWAVSASKSF